jgi:hypothetical protein
LALLSTGGMSVMSVSWLTRPSDPDQSWSASLLPGLSLVLRPLFGRVNALCRRSPPFSGHLQRGRTADAREWDATAENPSSGAYGIPQALPGDKMASAGSDWATNPATQIRWGLGYIREVYGTPAGAWVFWQANNWY